MEIRPAWPCAPTAVRQLNLETGIADVRGLDGYYCVLVVFRYRGEVLSQAYLPVTRGRIPTSALESHVHTLNGRIWEIESRRQQSTMTRGKFRASVVVCTRDRTADLSQCLPRLLPLIDQGHEVIVVDSCPSDDSSKVLVSKYPGLIYVLESCPGLSIARNRGIRASSGEVIAFTDDDAEVDPFWLPHLLRNFEDPTVGMVTGLALPIELETPSQVWFELTNTFSRGLRRRSFDVKNIDPLWAGALGAGVNTAFRRSVFDAVGFFDDALGPGTPARASDDHEMFYRILAGGHRAIYDPGAVVWHRHRRDWRALTNTVYNYGVSTFAWWTAALVFRKEYGLLRLAPGWFINYQVRHLLRTLLRRPNAIPLDLALAEFKGALMGPRAYFKSKRTMQEMSGRVTVDRDAFLQPEEMGTP
jgi:glycosyltransferase involved in cell wall biosynthesis